MGEIEQRLAELGIELPAPNTPIANFVLAVRTGSLVFVSGHGPIVDGEPVYTGKVSSEVSVEDAYQAARVTILGSLRTLQDELGTLDRVQRIVKLLGMVNSDSDFTEQPQVINGASDLLIEVFGERGRHARSAVGMASLPRGISVEIELVAEVSEEPLTQ